MNPHWMEQGAKWLVSGSLIVGLTGCSRSEETAWEKSEKKTISGKIRISQDLQEKVSPTDVIFIMAKGESGPPLAVKKVTATDLPLEYTLSEDDMMLPGMIFPEKVYVSARIDKDGNASPPQPGDMEGQAKNNPVPVGATAVDLEINKMY